MLLLENIVSDKVAIAAKYGVETSADQWPEPGLPHNLITDNAEFKSGNGNELIRKRNVNIISTAAWRPDHKSIVERSFQDFESKMVVAPDIPGRVKKEGRGEEDYRRDASLTKDDMIDLVINYILWRNNEWKMMHYPRSAEMIADGMPVHPTPMEVWRWSTAKYGTDPRPVELNSFRRNIYPEEHAKASRDGMEFKGLIYRCERGDREGWFVDDPRRAFSSFRARYNPDNVNTIYLHVGGETELVPCHLNLEKNEHEALRRSVLV